MTLFFLVLVWFPVFLFNGRPLIGIVRVFNRSGGIQVVGLHMSKVFGRIRHIEFVGVPSLFSQFYSNVLWFMSKNL